MITISTPNYEIVTVNGKDYVIFHPQFLKDGDWATLGDENPLPINIIELDTLNDLTKSLRETSEQNKEKLEQLNGLISEMSMLSRGPKGDKGDPGPPNLEAQKDIDDHKQDKNNPHEVTKSQIGLGNVQNYGIAIQSQAEAGVSNAVYMTPLRTKQAIDHQRPTLIDRKSGNATADEYPIGLSFMDINGNGTSDGYPQNYGTVITYKTHNNRTSQEFIGNGFNSSQEVKYTRHYHTSNDYGGWTPWQQAVYVDVEMGDDYMVKRFADGTMELSGMQEFNNVSYNSAGAIYRSGGLNVDYPVEFADDNVCVTLSSSSSSHWVDMSGNGSATGFPFRSFSYNSDSLDFIVRYQATGRWR